VGGGQLLRWLRRVGASKKNNEGRGPLRGERMGEKERGVGGSYGGGVSRGASQASSGAEWAVWDVWDSGGRAEHRVGTFVCTMERCIVNGEKKGGLGWLAGERDRRCGGFKQTCRGVRKAWWEKKGSGLLKYWERGSRRRSVWRRGPRTNPTRPRGHGMRWLERLRKGKADRWQMGRKMGRRSNVGASRSVARRWVSFAAHEG